MAISIMSLDPVRDGKRQLQEGKGKKGTIPFQALSFFPFTPVFQHKETIQNIVAIMIQLQYSYNTTGAINNTSEPVPPKERNAGAVDTISAAIGLTCLQQTTSSKKMEGTPYIRRITSWT